jgi:GNAT superfamily N-acetyltransferase
LTAQGEIELKELDQRGNQFARSLLKPLPISDRERLVEAMGVVERLLRLSSTRITVEDPTNEDAHWCVDQYFAELAKRFEQGFEADKSISAAPQETMPPRGAFLVARLDDEPIGCGALKSLAPGMGTIKRMWVAKSARGIGLGRRILLSLEDQAREMNLNVLRLETNRALKEAQVLYRRNGYQEVAAFNLDPYADFWFEKTL